MNNNNIPITPIGFITSPFKQKFAIPRQPNLAKAKGHITLTEQFNDIRVFKGLEGFSHVWVLFQFHKNSDKGWKPTVKAPRLGGNETLGVFASRSTHRPNGIGMSVLKRGGYYKHNGLVHLEVEGLDLLDGTPILDIKPYLPYADICESATDNLDDYAPIPNRQVVISEPARASLTKASMTHSDLETLIVSVLQQDPRPAYKHKLDDDPKEYRVMLYAYDIYFYVQQGTLVVTQLKAV